MEWLSSNWLLLALLGGCIAMHMFGHRDSGHRAQRTEGGGHGCCGGAADDEEKTSADVGAPPKEVPGR